MSACGCGAALRRAAIECSDPVDSEVQEVGPFGVVQNHPDFPPLMMRCPHGITWASQPTEWQIRDWELRRVP